MEGKVCVVTGASSGIGFEIAVGLAKLDARVVMVCRHLYRGQEALDKLHNTTPDANVDLVLGDLGSMSKTRELAQKLLVYTKIDVLVHNAGIWPQELNRNEDGMEESFCVNHLSSFLLTHLMLDRLKASAPSRVIFVNAGIYVYGKVDCNKTPYGMDFSRLTTYSATKLCSVLTLQQWANLLEGTGVTVNMIHPGVVHTKLGESTGFVGWALRQVKRTWKTPNQAAGHLVWLASSPELAGKSGLYFNEAKETPLASVATDDELCREMWRISMQFAGLEEESANENTQEVKDEDGDDTEKSGTEESD